MFWTLESQDPLSAWESRLYLPQQALAVVSLLSFYFSADMGVRGEVVCWVRKEGCWIRMVGCKECGIRMG